MPYNKGSRLAGEVASKLGHLDVIQSDLVNNLVQEFEHPEYKDFPELEAWQQIDTEAEPLSLVFCVDGSIQSVRSDTQPFREVAFIKTALLRLDNVAIARLDQESPHPLALRDILADSAIYHSTALPLKNITLPGHSNYNAVRRIIFDSFRDPSIDGLAMDALKWICYEKWQDEEVTSPDFECPSCAQIIDGLPFDSESYNCPHCTAVVYLTDVIGFHLEMVEDATPLTVATSYMLIHETMLLFAGVMKFWESGKLDIFDRCLFIKDGPLTLRSQYSKLVIPIRKFFEYAKSKSVTVHMMGQEKTGAFTDHLELIQQKAESPCYFVPSNEYVRNEVQQRPDRGEEYGHRTNYGNKIFIKSDRYHAIVASIPTGDYVDSSNLGQLIGVERILCTIPRLISHKHEGALVPVQLANGIASLSSYPSASILKVFAGLSSS